MGIPTAETVFRSGDTLILYARGQAVEALDRRKRGVGGELAHADAVAEQQKELERKKAEDEGSATGAD